MNIKTEFSEDEWFLISAMPGMIGAAMSNAAPSGVIGTIKEMSAAMRSAIQAKHDFPDSELIAALVQKAENWDEAKEKLTDYRERAQQRLKSANVTNRDELQAMALEECQAAVSLVEQKCTTDDVGAYKQWTVNVARTVAEAAKEGSILGFGGERVSANERVLLDKIESLLGVESGVLIA
jgi:hypothetical protein